MAFKMKGSAFKLGNVATKSALKQKPISEKARERYMAEELAKLRSEETIGDEDKAQDLRDARKAAENRWADEQAKKNITKEGRYIPKREGDEAMRRGAEIAGAAPVPMKSPMKQEVVTEETDPTEEVVTEEKVNPHPPKTFKHALFQATNQSKDDMLASMRRRQADLDSGMWDGDPKAIANHKRIIKAQQSILFPGGGMGGF